MTIAGAFDERAKLFATVRVSSHSPESRGGTHGVRQVAFDDGTADCLEQRLCTSVWALWVKSFRANEGSSLWSIVPASLPVQGGGAIAAKLEHLLADVDAASIADARRMSWEFLVDFLKERTNEERLSSRVQSTIRGVKR
ncbi:MAG: hypothetical protein QOJ99_4066 [Bryobacterales bacterium]|nr:hypothetical protein [Bryobacterales bacterium]